MAKRQTALKAFFSYTSSSGVEAIKATEQNASQMRLLVQVQAATQLSI